MRFKTKTMVSLLLASLYIVSATSCQKNSDAKNSSSTDYTAAVVQNEDDASVRVVPSQHTDGLSANDAENNIKLFVDNFSENIKSGINYIITRYDFNYDTNMYCTYASNIDYYMFFDGYHVDVSADTHDAMNEQPALVRMSVYDNSVEIPDDMREEIWMTRTSSVRVDSKDVDVFFSGHMIINDMHNAALFVDSHSAKDLNKLDDETVFGTDCYVFEDSVLSVKFYFLKTTGEFFGESDGSIFRFVNTGDVPDDVKSFVTNTVQAAKDDGCVYRISDKIEEYRAEHITVELNPDIVFVDKDHVETKVPASEFYPDKSIGLLSDSKYSFDVTEPMSNAYGLLGIDYGGYTLFALVKNKDVDGDDYFRLDGYSCEVNGYRHYINCGFPELTAQAKDFANQILPDNSAVSVVGALFVMESEWSKECYGSMTANICIRYSEGEIYIPFDVVDYMAGKRTVNKVKETDTEFYGCSDMSDDNFLQNLFTMSEGEKRVINSRYSDYTAYRFEGMQDILITGFSGDYCYDWYVLSMDDQFDDVISCVDLPVGHNTLKKISKDDDGYPFMSGNVYYVCSVSISDSDLERLGIIVEEGMSVADVYSALFSVFDKYAEEK